MKPSIQRRLMKQAITTKFNKINEMTHHRRMGDIDGMEESKLAIKNATKIIKNMNNENTLKITG